jgi:hypothetical protein
MNIVQFRSDKPETVFAPWWFYVIGEERLINIDFKKIASIILEKEKEIIESTPPAPDSASSDGYTGLGPNSLTSRYQNFNVLTWDDEEIQKLKEKIREKYIEFLEQVGAPRRKVWIQCWANVLRYGEEIKPHLHATHKYTYLGGHVTVQSENTSTMYINPINQINNPETYESINTIGKLTLFQNNIPHYTTKHLGKKERISIAFDIIVDENYNDYEPGRTTDNLILLDDPNK